MIRISHLTKRYGSFMALSDVSFEIEKGEIVGFLGPNGAGKTTTMRILTGFLPPSAGKVEIAGMDVLEESTEVKKKIGYLPENVPLYQDMEVEAFLNFFAELKHIKKEERKKHVDKILERCGLSKAKKEIIKRLSKGYRQRVGIAQALIGDPEVLILDEPTIGLDPKQVVEIRNLIKELGKKRTIILSTHILPEVSEVCNRVIIISQGKIVASDTPEKLTSFMAGVERVVVKIKGPKDQVFSSLSKLSGVKSVKEEKKFNEDVTSFIIESALGIDLRKVLAKEIINHGWDLLELRKESLKLEDIFLKLTK
jgi:ABC-2 type transport system ATP-binding protein